MRSQPNDSSSVSTGHDSDELQPLIDHSESSDLTPRELADRLRTHAIEMIDVREPYEWTIAHIDGAKLVPMDTVPDVVTTFDRDAEYVIYCHHGSRSAAAVEWLRACGFVRVRNLIGGIDRWSLDVDSSVRRY